MPARKTIAAADAARARRRQQRLLLAIGAIPVAVLVIVIGVFVQRQMTKLGPEEMPSSIGSSERKQIQETIQRFYDGVNSYNPQTAIEVLAGDELTTPEIDRLILEVAPLQSEELRFQVQSLGTTTLDSAAGTVSARVITNFGARDFLLARRKGQWRLAHVPDLIVPQDAGQMRMSWEITNTYRSDNGRTLYVAGNIKNTGSSLGYMLALGSFVHDGSGTALDTFRPALPGSPFLQPGGVSPFQLAFQSPSADIMLDPANVVLVPDLRATAANSDTAWKKNFEVAPPRLAWPLAQSTIDISNHERQQYGVALWGHLRDASGRLLGVAPIYSGTLASDTTQSVPLNLKLPAALMSVASIDLVMIQTTN
ncbi:MAG: hypothetical protein K1X87_04325 [Dehalococcoidia bacterium]|nr:hypothetical protein [Dehalococcoidia bacterium]